MSWHDTGLPNMPAAVYALDELVMLVNIALGTAQSAACVNGVPSGAEVDIALILQAVNHALTGCSG